MVQIYALCGGYLELNRASMIPDSEPRTLDDTGGLLSHYPSPGTGAL